MVRFGYPAMGLGLCMLCLPGWLCAQVGPDTLSMRVAESVPSADRAELIVSALRSRDIALKQFTCELTETDDAADATRASGAPRTTRQFVLKRNGEKTLVWGIVVQNGDEASDFTIAWDGARESSLFTIPHSTQRRAEIRDIQQPILRQIAYLQCLGMRVDDQDITLARWVADRQNDSSSKVTGTLEAQGDSSMLVLEVASNTSDKKFWLDPSRGNMVVKSSYTSGDSWQTQTVEEAEPRGDLWIPTRVSCRRGTKDSTNPLHEDSYIVTHFNRAPVTDGDVQISFPPGVHVVDFVRHLSFTRDRMGEEHYFPLYDPQMGTVTMNLPVTRPAGDVALPASAPANIAAPPLDAGSGDGFLPNPAWLEASTEVALAGGVMIAIRLLFNYARLRRRRAVRR